MLDLTKRYQATPPDQKKMIVLEFVAAGIVFSIVGLVMFMVFSYRPV